MISAPPLTIVLCTAVADQACDREFKTQKDYDAHIDAHVPCPVHGCKFRGSRRVVLFAHAYCVGTA